MEVVPVSGCANCAGTGTTIIAVVALILVIILIILVIIFYFYPSKATLLEVRGVNFNVIPGTSNGASGITGFTGPAPSVNLQTGSNYLYISNPLTGPLNVVIQPSNDNFIGMTIGVKNTSPPGGGTITLVPGAGVELNPSNDLTVPPGDFAWLVDQGPSINNFLRL